MDTKRVSLPTKTGPASPEAKEPERNQIRARCNNLAAVGDFEGAGIEHAVTDAVVTRNQSKEPALKSLYSQRTQRAYEKFKKDLKELQQERKANEAVTLVALIRRAGPIRYVAGRHCHAKHRFSMS